MESHKPPIRIIVPGKVFRNEATDATHEAQFYQLEGLCVDKDISLGHLKGTLEYFFSKFFSGKTEVRFRPSFFPFY
jgi:phenylalanyl-tRNA synthetase alpha chain